MEVKSTYGDNLADQVETVTHDDIDAECNQFEGAIHFTASGICVLQHNQMLITIGFSLVHFN